MLQYVIVTKNVGSEWWSCKSFYESRSDDSEISQFDVLGSWVLESWVLGSLILRWFISFTAAVEGWRVKWDVRSLLRNFRKKTRSRNRERIAIIVRERNEKASRKRHDTQKSRKNRQSIKKSRKNRKKKQHQMILRSRISRNRRQNFVSFFWQRDEETQTSKHWDD